MTDGDERLAGGSGEDQGHVIGGIYYCGNPLDRCIGCTVHGRIALRRVDGTLAPTGVAGALFGAGRAAPPPRQAPGVLSPRTVLRTLQSRVPWYRSVISEDLERDINAWVASAMRERLRERDEALLRLLTAFVVTPSFVNEMTGGPE